MPKKKSKPSAAFTQPPLLMAANQTPAGVPAPPPAPVGPKVAPASGKVRTRPRGSGPTTDAHLGKGYRHLGKC